MLTGGLALASEQNNQRKAESRGCRLAGKDEGGCEGEEEGQLEMAEKARGVVGLPPCRGFVWRHILRGAKASAARRLSSVVCVEWSGGVEGEGEKGESAMV